MSLSMQKHNVNPPCQWQHPYHLVRWSQQILCIRQEDSDCQSESIKYWVRGQKGNHIERFPNASVIKKSTRLFSKDISTYETTTNNYFNVNPYTNWFKIQNTLYAPWMQVMAARWQHHKRHIIILPSTLTSNVRLQRPRHGVSCQRRLHVLWTSSSKKLGIW